MKKIIQILLVENPIGNHIVGLGDNGKLYIWDYKKDWVDYAKFSAKLLKKLNLI